MTLPVNPRHLLPGLAAFVVALLVALLGLRANAHSPAPQPRPRRRPAARSSCDCWASTTSTGTSSHPSPASAGPPGSSPTSTRRPCPGARFSVHAGDMVGASPLISSWFHDEPTIEAANALGFDVGTLGNHEFDEGGDELLRLLHGGQRKGPGALKRDADGTLVNTSSQDFAGAQFPTSRPTPSIATGSCCCRPT